MNCAQHPTYNKTEDYKYDIAACLLEGYTSSYTTPLCDLDYETIAQDASEYTGQIWGVGITGSSGYCDVNSLYYRYSESFYLDVISSVYKKSGDDLSSFMYNGCYYIFYDPDDPTINYYVCSGDSGGALILMNNGYTCLWGTISHGFVYSDGRHALDGFPIYDKNRTSDFNCIAKQLTDGNCELFPTSVSTNLQPSGVPSPGPTGMPAPNPTPQPVPAPSTSPTGKPFPAPSTPPTDQPVPAPSTSPTGKPFPAPSISPTDQPVPAPSTRPTSKPIIVSTSLPPTPDQTNLSTVASTTAPTKRPTREPISVFQPSREPSVNPTDMPSVESNDDEKASIWILVYIFFGSLGGSALVFYFIKEWTQNQALPARPAQAQAAARPAQAQARSVEAVSTNYI